MVDERIKKLAGVLVNYSMAIKKGDYLVIDGNDLTQPLIREIYREAVKKGANVDVKVVIPGLEEIFLTEASNEQLEFISPIGKIPIEKADAMLHIWGDYNTKRLNNIDSKKIQKAQATYGKYFTKMLERIEKKDLRWCGTQFPTHANAQDGDMNLEEYEDFIFKAMLLDKDDPAQAWKEISKKQDKICRYMEAKKTLHIKSKDTDLRMKIEGRRWINDDGKMNMPDGEIFTTPIEDSVEGVIRFSYPGIFMGKEIQDITLEFSKGKVVKASAVKGEDLLLELLDTDEGARRIGEMAVGMNYGIQKFTKNMLFDEKMGGTIHAALGGVPDDTGGKNDSAIHWDLLCDMKDGGEIYADGELVYKDGKFVIEV